MIKVDLAPSPLVKILTLPDCWTPPITCPPVTLVYVEFSSHDESKTKLPLKELAGCKPGSTWYCKTDRITPLSLAVNAGPRVE